MKPLRLRPLLTGGSLKMTRVSSCAAAADSSVTFELCVVIHAAWVVRGADGGGGKPPPYGVSDLGAGTRSNRTQPHPTPAALRSKPLGEAFKQ